MYLGLIIQPRKKRDDTPSVARLAAHWLREVRAMEACERSGVRYELHMRRAAAFQVEPAAVVWLAV